MPTDEVFITKLPEVTLDAYGARLDYYSGGARYVRRYPLSMWRELLERGTRQLNEYERQERERGCIIKGRFGEG